MDEWLKFLRELGFPAAVAFFVLWRVDTTLHHILRELAALRLELRDLAATDGRGHAP